jgi:hypothetical protein
LDKPKNRKFSKHVYQHRQFLGSKIDIEIIKPKTFRIRYFSSEKEHLKIGEKQLKYSQKLEY